jgi:protein-disulfide isomerase
MYRRPNLREQLAEHCVGLRMIVARLLCAMFLLAVAVQAAPDGQQSAKAQSALAAPDKTYGLNTAPIRMEVFTDYQCPMCRAFYDQTLRHVIDEYVPSGKVYLVHHDFPLLMHKYSGEAARWADACAEVGDFAPVEAALYDNQESWGADGNIAKYVAAVMPAGDFRRVQLIMKGSSLPAPQATTASVDPMAGISHPCAMDAYIAQDIKLGYKIGAPGTPDFVITYRGNTFAPVYSAVSWPVLKQLFDSLLRQ